MSAAGRGRLGPTALLVGAAIVVLALVAVGTAFLRMHTREPDGPADAAERWADAKLDHDLDGARARQCRRDLRTSFDLIGLTSGSISGVSATSVREVSRERWSVRLQTEPAATGSSLRVIVVRRDGDYLVCS